MPFLLHTGATRSVCPFLIASKTSETQEIIGTTGQQKRVPLLQSRERHLGSIIVTHRFLYISDCPVELLGRDILTKLNASIPFEPEGICTKVGTA